MISFFGLFSRVLLGVGIYLSHKWYQRAWSYDFNLHRSYFDPHIGNNYETFLLAVAVGLLLWALAGGVIVRGILSLFTQTKGSAGRDALPKRSRQRAREHRLSRPDSSELRIEENLSRDLEAVLGLTSDRPAILLGHSIGGMITLTFCRLFPEALRARVRAIALVQTTYTNPVRTTKMASLFTALERPVIVPLLHLTIWLSPLVWLSNWMSYLNGSAFLSTKSSGFAGPKLGSHLIS